VARSLLPGQSSRILVVDPTTGRSDVVFASDRTLVEAPNWTPEGRWLVVNADGALWRLPADPGAPGGGVLSPVAMPGVPEINNDHCLSPDGATAYVSAKDGHVYAVPLDAGEVRRVTAPHPEGRGYKNYLHGVSPDGSTLSAIVGSRPTPSATDDEWRTNVALVTVSDGSTTLLTDDEHPDDGAEIAPDGEWVWFSTERFTSDPGHAQLARMRLDGSALTRVSSTPTVDWFPHPSPDGRLLLSLSYEAGTRGHPENRDVVLRIQEIAPGAPVRDLLRLFGGQGTTNVNGWAPDSRRFACVDYPRG
jgi:Tol biopolymer transport system component